VHDHAQLGRLVVELLEGLLAHFHQFQPRDRTHSLGLGKLVEGAAVRVPEGKAG